MDRKTQGREMRKLGVALTSVDRVTSDQGGAGNFRSVRREDDARGRYEKYVLTDGKPVGAILLGSMKTHAS